jgi:hypothetical protein
MNTLAIAVSTTEAKASFLAGRVNGPADAYRHIVGVGEMTRRLGPNMAGSLGDLHEIQGQASAVRREMMGRRRDPINDAAATAMDRRNNLIGVSIGQRARSFDDVLSMARETIERSPVDGSGGMIGAVWLPRRDWLANPSSDEANGIGLARIGAGCPGATSPNTGWAARHTAEAPTIAFLPLNGAPHWMQKSGPSGR